MKNKPAKYSTKPAPKMDRREMMFGSNAIADHFNKLTPAEAERLAILAEECAEVIQIVGKILRHGYESFHPGDADRLTNRALLESELGHVMAGLSLMTEASDVSELEIQKGRLVKLERIDRYLHHNASKP